MKRFVVQRCFARTLSYVQGQSPSTKTREYFYYIDHQGQLFLDDAKLKNFITCFKDKKFLAFFFRRIKPNTSGRYEKEFPFISPCGPETNYIRCDDLPVVFTHLLDKNGQVIEDIKTYGQTEVEDTHTRDHLDTLEDEITGLKDTISREIHSNFSGKPTQSSDADSPKFPKRQIVRKDANLDASPEQLSYGGTGKILTLSFLPHKLCMLPDSGRVYHTGPAHLGGIGLVKSSLAIELSRFFIYEHGAKESQPPVGFKWKGKTWELDNSVLNVSSMDQ